MKFKVILAVLVVFSCQTIGSSYAAESIYNKGSVSSKKSSTKSSNYNSFNTSGGGSRGPINLKDYSSNSKQSRARTSSAAAESRKAVYGSKQQNSDKYRLSMSPDKARKLRADYAHQEVKRRENRDKELAKQTADAREVVAAQSSGTTLDRKVNFQQEVIEEEIPKKKKKRVYKKEKEGYQMPQRVFSFN